MTIGILIGLTSNSTVSFRKNLILTTQLTLYTNSIIKCLNIMNTFAKSLEIERFPLIKQNEEHNYTSQDQSKYHKESSFNGIIGVISGKKACYFLYIMKNIKELTLIV